MERSRWFRKCECSSPRVNLKEAEGGLRCGMASLDDVSSFPIAVFLPHLRERKILSTIGGQQPEQTVLKFFYPTGNCEITAQT